MLLCFGLNTISLLYVFCSREFTSNKILIVNLAIADILNSSCVPFFASQFTAKSSPSKFGCRVSYFIDVTTMLVNVYTIAFLTLERYFSIKQLKLYNKSSKIKLTILNIIILWVISVLFSLPKTFSIVLVYDSESKIYRCYSMVDDNQEKIYWVLKLLAAFIIPYIFLIISSILLIRVLHEWWQKSSNLFNSSAFYTEKSLLLNKIDTTSQTGSIKTKNLDNVCKNRRAFKIKRKATRVVLAIVYIFLCTWLPIWLFQITIAFSNDENLFFRLMNNVTLIMTYLTGVFNPLVLIIFTENFQDFISNLKSCF